MEPWITAEQQARILWTCDVPEKLHPLSANALKHFLEHDLPVGEFARLFALPNSDYAAIADCIVAYFKIATSIALL